jgi:cell division protein FtsI (penicillin-binding protein 3)
MEGALRLMDVPPDDIDTWLAAQAAAEAKRSGNHAPAAAPAANDDTDDGLPDDATATVAGATR